MNDNFEIPVTYNGQDLSFSAKLIAAGYIHKIQVNIYGEEIYFEPDEEGIYRATSTGSFASEGPQMDIGLLREIALVIESVNN